MGLDAARIKHLIQSHIPGAKVLVNDVRGDQLYYQVSVTAESFKNFPELDRQRLVYRSLGPEAELEFPILEIRTASLLRNQKPPHE